MQKNSWPAAAGQTQYSDCVRVDWYNVCLVPFYWLLLLGSQVTDLIGYCGRHINIFFDKVYYALLVVIDKMPLNLRVKYYLMVATGWLATALLLGTLVWSIILVNQIKMASVIDNSTTAESSPTLSGINIDTSLNSKRWPGMVHEATGSSAMTLVDDDIVALLASVENLTPAQTQELSQTEKLDIALLYYHLGQREKYDYWIQQAWLMDPNSEFFVR